MSLSFKKPLPRYVDSILYPSLPKLLLLPKLFLIGLLLFIQFDGRVWAIDPKNDETTCKVVLLTGSGKGNPFWELFGEFMRETTSDLNMQLKVRHADNDTRRMRDLIIAECRRKEKPDAIVVQGFKQTGLRSLRNANRHEVPIFLVNSGLSEDQRVAAGEPRGKIRSWIGEMVPDDESAGFQLAEELINEAIRLKRVGEDGLVHVIGINGTISDFASIQRKKGLKRAIADRADEAVLDQVISADWDQKLARNRCRILQRRYPEASVIWTASDHMAIGVIDAMTELKRVPGDDVIIGGVDATPEALRRIEEGSLHATVGGHFMEGGWVAVLLYDYFAGSKDVPADYKSPMKLVTKETLDQYKAAVDESTWERFDFRQLSRVVHPEMGEYPFGVDVIANVAIAEEVKSDHEDISTESVGNRP